MSVLRSRVLTTTPSHSDLVSLMLRHTTGWSIHFIPLQLHLRLGRVRCYPKEMLREFNSTSNSDITHLKFGTKFIVETCFLVAWPFSQHRILEAFGERRYVADWNMSGTRIFQYTPSKIFGSSPTLNWRPPCRRNSKISFIWGVRQRKDPNTIVHSILLLYHPKRKNQHRHLAIKKTRKARRQRPINGIHLGSTRNQRFSRPTMRNMIHHSLRLFIGHSLCAGGQLEYWY